MAVIDKDADSNYFNGHLLLAMPSIGDPRFEKAVIFICAHDERGALGIVINNPLPDLNFGSLIQDLEVKSNIILPEPLYTLPVHQGGPVDTARGFLVHSNDFEQQDTIKVTNDIYTTGTIDAVRSLQNSTAPKHLLFAIGHAGWGAGQLEQEVMENAWLTLPADKDLLFEEHTSSIWDNALGKLGITSDKLSHLTGRA